MVPYGRNRFKEAAIYSLHLQCMWRLRNNNDILVVKMDVYTPKTDYPEDEDFNWDESDSSLFDEKAAALNEELKKGLYIEEINANTYGDIRFTFSNGWLLEVYTDVSDDSECWRMFKNGDLDSHMVVTGKGFLQEK